MKLVETHYIKRNHAYFGECMALCAQSKLLYNEANYHIRQSFINDNKYISAIDIKKQFQKQSDNYYKLPTKVSSETLRVLHQNWLSFFKAIKDYKKHPEKYQGRPSLPKYKKQYFPVIYDRQAISTRSLKNNIIKLSGTNIQIPYQHPEQPVKQARIIPLNKYLFKIEIVYEQGVKTTANIKQIAIDFGINNIVSLTGQQIKPLIITGRTLKSINQYYNKRKAKLQSTLPKEHKKSNRITKLSNKRNSKINDYMHKTSRAVINYCLTNNVGVITIGYNANWKQGVRLGKRNNQSFVGIPFYKLLNQIKYKAELEGITVKTQEEAYTSKCSWLDNESVGRHINYRGRRVKRGLFKTSTGITVNADINAAANILRKSNSQFTPSNEGIEAVSVPPVVVNPLQTFL